MKSAVVLWIIDVNDWAFIHLFEWRWLNLLEILRLEKSSFSSWASVSKVKMKWYLVWQRLHCKWIGFQWRSFIPFKILGLSFSEILQKFTVPYNALNKLPEGWFCSCSPLHLDWSSSIPAIVVPAKPLQALGPVSLHNFLTVWGLQICLSLKFQFEELHLERHLVRCDGYLQLISVGTE